MEIRDDIPALIAAYTKESENYVEHKFQVFLYESPFTNFHISFSRLESTNLPSRKDLATPNSLTSSSSSHSARFQSISVLLYHHLRIY